MLNTYYVRQNCTTCTTNPLNVAGITANFYFGFAHDAATGKRDLLAAQITPGCACYTTVAVFVSD